MFPITHNGLVCDETGLVKDAPKDSVTCAICGKVCPRPFGSVSTGYAIMRDEEGHDAYVCYSCAGEMDRQRMIETGYHGCLYLSVKVTHERTSEPLGSDSYLYHYNKKTGLYYRNEYEVTNWPGSLRFKVGTVNKSTQYTPTGGYYEREDFWFKGPDGFTWHGRVQVGNLARCKRTKEV